LQGIAIKVARRHSLQVKAMMHCILRPRHPKLIKSSATAEGPRDALCQLKSCQRLHICAKNHIWKGLQ